MSQFLIRTFHALFVWPILASLSLLCAAHAGPLSHSLPTVPFDNIAWDFPAGERVVAIGDVHGDFTALMAALEGMHLVDRMGKWIGGKTHLVMVGDLNDRGEHTRAVMDLIMSLEEQAEAVGGHVHTLLGNHEVMGVEGIFKENEKLRFATLEEARYFAPPTATPSEAKAALQKAYLGDGVYARWLRRRNSIVRIGEMLFVHAGVESWAMHTDNGQINATVRAWVAHMQGHGPEPAPETRWVLHGSVDPKVHEVEGPFWTRKLAYESAFLPPAVLDQILVAQKVKHIVVGHSSKSEPIRTSYDGKVYLIDTGMNMEVYHGLPTALEVLPSGEVKTHAFAQPDVNHPILAEYRQSWLKGEPYHFPAPEYVSPLSEPPPASSRRAPNELPSHPGKPCMSALEFAFWAQSLAPRRRH